MSLYKCKHNIMHRILVARASDIIFCWVKQITNTLFISNNVEDDCQYWLNLKDMKLTSPNYPKLYFADGRGCDWLLTAPEGYIIALQFNDFEVITIPSLYIF